MESVPIDGNLKETVRAAMRAKVRTWRQIALRIGIRWSLARLDLL